MLVKILLTLSTAAFVIVGAVVGARLLLQARRTRRLPELAVGTALLGIAGIAYPLVLVVRVPGLLPPAAHATVFGLAMAIAAVGYFAVFVFTWIVFRRRSAWAIALVAIGGAALLAQAGGSIAVAISLPDPERYPDLTRDWALLRRAAAAVAFGWSGVESLVYFGRMRRRLELGLADPVVTNRFLLWAVASAGAGTGTGVNAAIMLVDARALEHPASLAVIAVSGLATAAALYLAFLPHAWLTDRLRARPEGTRS